MQEKLSWEPTSNRFVAFFDIMGFKDLVLKTDHNKIVELLEGLSLKREELNLLNNHSPEDENLKMGETRSFTFSDSIIFFSKGETLEDIKKILIDCFFLQREALRLEIPIKGALSYGKITLKIDNSLYFGQPIIDAFLLQEDLHLYSIIADNHFEKKGKELLHNSSMWDFDNLFEFYKTPLKSGRAYHYIAKPSENDKKTYITCLNNLYLTVSGKPRQYIDNSLDFYNSVYTK
ncbi:MAG: hypothetical protein K0Q95_2097 [Bacteroidota bacterium]|jgi:hypothetical protein|nr:hypothetical protein [Bacteroidota bacterium]